MLGRHIESRKRSSSVLDVLSISVVGGSIAGLAVAFTLARAGHRVTIFEASDGKNNRCGALKLPPNGTLCLNRWGLKTKLDKCGRKFMRCNFIRTGNDRLVGSLLLNALLQHEAFLSQGVADYTCVKDSQLWDWLHKLATDSGATCRFGSKVIKVNPTRPSITLESGEEIIADLIVGADSADGITRSVVGGEGSDASGNRYLTISCMLPCEEFSADPELKTLLNDSSLFIWAGEDVQMQGQMNKGAETFTITLGYKLPQNVALDPSIKSSKWYDHFKLEDFSFIDYSKFTGRSLKLLNMARGVKSNVSLHTEVELLDDLVSDSGKVVLIGNAAHGMPPGMQHNTSLGLEDAEALGYLFSRIPSRTLVPRFLMAYEEIRSSRIVHASQRELSLLQSWIMPEGPVRDQFDTFLAKSAVQDTTMDDEDLWVLWSETLNMWLYDVNEKVDDWWSKWGTGILREYWEPENEPTAIFVDRNISHQ